MTGLEILVKKTEREGKYMYVEEYMYVEVSFHWMIYVYNMKYGISKMRTTWEYATVHTLSIRVVFSLWGC